MSKKINFGIIGTGTIANKFALGLQYVEGARLYAVASRNIHSANSFGNQYKVEKRYDNYEALAKDEQVDVVYIATPHTLHKENTILCLRNKKNVLCEKPFGVNATEVKEMIRVAQEEKVFLMEAMWTRYLPVIKKVKGWVEGGLVGKIKMITADFGYRDDIDLEHITFNKDMAGGALLDVGIYPISFASMIFKMQPKEIKSTVHIGDLTGVDEESAYLFNYGGGKIALLSSALRTETLQEAQIIGEEGYIRIPNFWCATTATLCRPDQDDEVIHMPMIGNGYNYEAQEVIECLGRGQLESESMKLQESLEILQTMDSIRQQWNLVYPCEEKET